MIVTFDLHDDDTEGLETIRFGFEGSDYELEVCVEHSEQVHEQLQELIGRVRRVGGGRGRRRSSAPRPSAARPARSASGPPPATDRERLQAIREWARGHGHPDLS